MEMELCCLLLLLFGYLYHVASGKPVKRAARVSPDGQCLHANTSTYDVPGSSWIFTQCDDCGARPI